MKLGAIGGDAGRPRQCSRLVREAPGGRRASSIIWTGRGLHAPTPSPAMGFLAAVPRRACRSASSILPLDSRTPTLLAMTAVGTRQAVARAHRPGAGRHPGPQVDRGRSTGWPYDAPLGPHPGDHRDLPLGVAPRPPRSTRRRPTTATRCRSAEGQGDRTRQGAQDHGPSRPRDASLILRRVHSGRRTSTDDAPSSPRGGFRCTTGPSGLTSSGGPPLEARCRESVRPTCLPLEIVAGGSLAIGRRRSSAAATGTARCWPPVTPGGSVASKREELATTIVCERYGPYLSPRRPTAPIQRPVYLDGDIAQGGQPASLHPSAELVAGPCRSSATPPLRQARPCGSRCRLGPASASDTAARRSLDRIVRTGAIAASRARADPERIPGGDPSQWPAGCSLWARRSSSRSRARGPRSLASSASWRSASSTTSDIDPGSRSCSWWIVAPRTPCRSRNEPWYNPRALRALTGRRSTSTQSSARMFSWNHMEWSMDGPPRPMIALLLLAEAGAEIRQIGQRRPGASTGRRRAERPNGPTGSR